ncbi:MAG: hypothetical protein KGK07_14515 [Chloroflexota bacterium]|nr:hypothetical protein [Chloroflexota bacterium]
MDHWNRRWCPKPWPLPARLTPKRRTHIRNRLATYSAEQLCRAADNLRASPWHAGDNDRGWRADPEFLFRSDEQVERWLQAPDGPNRSPPIRAYGGRRGEEGETWS